MENSERLGREARPGIEYDTSLPSTSFECRTARPLLGPVPDWECRKDYDLDGNQETHFNGSSKFLVAKTIHGS